MGNQSLFFLEIQCFLTSNMDCIRILKLFQLHNTCCVCYLLNSLSTLWTKTYSNAFLCNVDALVHIVNHYDPDYLRFLLLYYIYLSILRLSAHTNCHLFIHFLVIAKVAQLSRGQEDPELLLDSPFSHGGKFNFSMLKPFFSPFTVLGFTV